jgi:CBS domain-containing protein
MLSNSSRTASRIKAVHSSPALVVLRRQAVALSLLSCETGTFHLDHRVLSLHSTVERKEGPMRATEYFVHACDPKTLIVRQIMEDAVVTVSPSSSAMVVAELLSEHNFGSVPVTETDGTLRGLVTEFDLLKAVEQGRDLREVSVSEIMTRDVITTTEEMPLMNLIHVLQERHLIRLPVVKDRKLIGMVARRDIVFAYVKARANYWP